MQMTKKDCEVRRQWLLELAERALRTLDMPEPDGEPMGCQKTVAAFAAGMAVETVCKAADELVNLPPRMPPPMEWVAGLAGVYGLAIRTQMGKDTWAAGQALKALEALKNMVQK